MTIVVSEMAYKTACGMESIYVCGVHHLRVQGTMNKFREHAVSNLSDWFILYNCPLNACMGVLPLEGLPVDRSRIKQAFLSLPIAEAFQHLFLDQNIEQG